MTNSPSPKYGKMDGGWTPGSPLFEEFLNELAWFRLREQHPCTLPTEGAVAHQAAKIRNNLAQEAAAPDLLAAAQLAETEINRWRETGAPNIPKVMDAQDALRAAIHRARSTDGGNT